MLLGVAAAPLAAADDLKHKKAKVVRKMDGAHEDLDQSSNRLRAATAALSAAQAELNKARAHLSKTRGELAAAEALDRQMQAKLDAAIARLAQARADLDAGREQVAEQEHELGRIIVANYQTGDPALMGLSMVLTTQDPAELTGQLNSVRNVIDKEAVTLSRLDASKVLLTVQEAEVEEAKAEVAKERKAAAENLARKQRLEKQAESQEQQVSNLVELRANAENEAEKARNADLATLKSLEKERDRISAILKKRAEEARRRAAAAAAAASAAGRDTGPVHSNGYLDYPVPGEITSPYGWRIHPIYGYRSLHDGIDFRAPCGSPIYAPAPGRVIDEYFQTAWGNRIIIDHGWERGVGLATISNHLSSYAVGVGERVERGQIIGFAGTTGWSTGCHLHFTVLQNGEPVNPMRWF
jgi:murein DD-endopeptidase MepM/ murein hydrolase activator NlpD